MAAVLPRTVADRLARSPIQLSGWDLARRLPARPVQNVIRLPMQHKAHCQGAYIRLFYISAEKSAYLTIGAFLHRYMSAGGAGKPPPPPHEVLFAEVCGQHIKELHIRRWLSQRPASDLIQQGMIRLTPARPHQRPQIAFHAAAGGFKMLSGLLVEALGDQQNMVGLLLHLFQHIDGVVKAGQLSRYAQQTKKAIRIQRNIQILLRDITYQRHNDPPYSYSDVNGLTIREGRATNNWSFISGPLI